MSPSTSESRGALVATGLRVVRHVNRSYVPFLAGSLAYHAFLLLGPLLAVLLVVVSAVGGEPTVTYLVEFTRPFLTPRGRALFADAVRNSTRHTGVVVLGVAAIGWSLFRIFRGLDVVFARIYGTDVHESVSDQIRDGVVATLAITVGLGAVLAAGLVAVVLPWEPLAGVFNTLLLLAVLAIVFFPLYYVVPNVEVSAREVVPGTVVGACGWLVFHIFFELYASYGVTIRTYGVLGVMLSVLVWLYGSMFLLLLGAVINAVLAERV